jgi:hypothetical protein
MARARPVLLFVAACALAPEARGQAPAELASGFAADLWRTDGTTAGTAFVHAVDFFGSLAAFVAVGDTVFFAGSDPLDPGSTPPAPPAVPLLPPWGLALLAGALLLSGWARLRPGARSR